MLYRSVKFSTLILFHRDALWTKLIIQNCKLHSDITIMYEILSEMKFTKWSIFCTKKLPEYNIPDPSSFKFLMQLPMSPNSSHSPPSTPSSGLPISLSVSPSTVSSIPSKGGEINIPDHCHPKIDQCLANQCLTESARCDMVRTLVYHFLPNQASLPENNVNILPGTWSLSTLFLGMIWEMDM